MTAPSFTRLYFYSIFVEARIYKVKTSKNFRLFVKLIGPISVFLSHVPFVRHLDTFGMERWVEVISIHIPMYIIESVYRQLGIVNAKISIKNEKEKKKRKTTPIRAVGQLCNINCTRHMVICVNRMAPNSWRTLIAPFDIVRIDLVL